MTPPLHTPSDNAWVAKSNDKARKELFPRIAHAKKSDLTEMEIWEIKQKDDIEITFLGVINKFKRIKNLADSNNSCT